MDLENMLSFYLWVKSMNCVTNCIKLGTKLAQTLQGMQLSSMHVLLNLIEFEQIYHGENGQLP
jgi:hypothetical protein